MTATDTRREALLAQIRGLRDGWGDTAVREAVDAVLDPPPEWGVRFAGGLQDVTVCDSEGEARAIAADGAPYGMVLLTRRPGGTWTEPAL